MMGLLISLFVLSFLIFIHELGHFLAAKKAGIEIEEFGFGYPPRIIGKKIGKTIYSINFIPLGGFVKIEEKSFGKESKRVRAPVLLAGTLMNFLLGILLFSLIYSILGIPQKQGFVKIVGVAEGSPAEEAGMREQDVVRKIKNNKEFIKFINENLGKEVEIELERQGVILSVVVIPRSEPPEGEGALGVAISDSKMVKPVFWQRPFLSLWFGTKEAFGWTGAVFGGVGRMIYDLAFKGVMPKGLAGPVGIVQITTSVARVGILALLQFVGVLSVNLAVLNLLPIPALDGGRLLFLGVEMITGKKTQPKFEKWVHAVGMFILLLLMLAITIQDIKRIFGTTSWPF